MLDLRNQTVGKYRVVDFIGAGGMGEVYRAIDQNSGRIVALKILTGLAADPRSAGRFRNEARIQAGLQHPGIARLYEYLEFDGRPCLVLEFIDGPTLEADLREHGPLSPRSAAGLAKQVASAVAYLHERNIVHRDLKTSNVKVTPGGQTKLLDFGIARAEDTERLTQTGTVVGTVETLAPELIDGQPASPRSDVWALGVMLFELLTGRLPFQAGTILETCRQILRDTPPRPSELRADGRRELDDIVGRCLRKKPRQRFADAAELLAALASLEIRSTTETSSSGRAAAAGLPAWPPGHWRPAVAGLALLALLAAAIAFVAGRGAEDSGPGDSPVSQSGPLHTVTVDVFGRPADVYEQGQKAGVTPFEVRAPYGARVELILRRDGFEDHTVRFDVSERNVFTYDMKPLPAAAGGR